MKDTSLPAKAVYHFATVVLFFVAASARAAVTNGDFETGNLSGWSPIGASHADTAAIGVTPPQATYQGYIDNTGNFAALIPAVVVHLGGGSIGTSILSLGEGSPTTGSAITQDVTVGAGDVLSFDWNFLTDEHDEDLPFNDFAIYTVDSSAFFLASRNSTFFTLNMVSPPAGFDGQTNYANENYTFPSAGTFKLGFAVFNVGDSGHNSVLLVDSINIAPAPEPAGLAMLALGAGTLFSRGPRRAA